MSFALFPEDGYDIAVLYGAISMNVEDNTQIYPKKCIK